LSKSGSNVLVMTLDVSCEPVCRLECANLCVPLRLVEHDVADSFNHRLLKIDLQLRLQQRHRLRSRDDSIADRTSSILAILIVDY